MEWFTDLFLRPSIIQTIVLISLVSALGLKLGTLKIFRVSLGITFVFFVGILLGHLDLDIEKDLVLFAQNFGLIMFIYALGLQVGPGFFSSLKKSGLKLNVLAMAVVFLGIAMAISMSFIFDISIPNVVGILCGAVTHTPALGAAQQAASSPGIDSKVIADMASATAVTYPLGVIGVILAIILLRKIFSPKEFITKSSEDGTDANEPFIGEFMVVNPALSNKTIKDLMKVSPRKFIISRVTKSDRVLNAESDTLIELNDHLMIIARKADVSLIEVFLGKKVDKDWNKSGIDWNAIDNSRLISKQILVTKNEINGKKLGALRLRNQYKVNITRINRVGIQLLASPNLSLQIGDSLTIVGEAGQVEEVAKILGDKVKILQRPNLIAIFLGIALGLILGALPIPFPGMTMPIKLGIAGGPIIVGILMGAFGPRFKITTYTTESANLLMREFGLVVYLACLGIDAGEHFFETVFRPEGVLWIGLGFVLTVVPVMIVGIITMRIFNFTYGKSVGMLCGSMANPIALEFINSHVDSDEPSVGYATVYPITTFLRIISAQMIILILM